jgi:ankyrin repeat protein
MVNVLLENGADINPQNNEGSSPLCGAAEWSSESMVHLLLEKGAVLDLRDIHGKTLLFYVIRDWDQDRTEKISLLLEKGADINARDENGFTPLKWALYLKDARSDSRGLEVIVSLLVERGGVV